MENANRCARRSQGIKYTFRSGAKLKVTITYDGCIGRNGN